jgi:hypothetical protein
MSETCSICKQPFREFVVGERVFVSMHPSRADCIAAVIRRCAEIAERYYADGEAAPAIRDAFPEAFAK